MKSPLVSAKLTRKFYEPVALLVCLNGIFKEKTSRRTAEILCDSNLELEEIFHSFVCKLGQLCDSRPRGRTVTSFSILQKPEGIEYVFASNKRSVIELETTRAYVAAILKCLGEAQLEDDEKQAELHTRLLEDILLFNLPRIKRYLSCLVRELDSCINICTSEETPDGMSPLFAL